ncbi:MAG: cell wall-binding repeat-containing protein [Acidimicrobiia bacterium]|nr:cell wall-binding repeat-containing protein [Acidimicrobiia bacterium]
MHAPRPRVPSMFALGRQRLVALLITLAIALAVGPLPSAGAAAPTNDDFANSEALGPLPSTVTQSTADATLEGSEPSSSCASAFVLGATVWFEYTAEATGTLTADTDGSDYDTVIGVWTGSALNNLVEVGCDDDGGDGLQSSLSFTAQAGVVYRFQVGGYNAAVGSLTFNLASDTPPLPTVANDNFADAEILGPLPSTVTQSTVDATLEPGEPGPSYVQATVWFGYTAVATGLLIADTDGSDFETMIGVWTGTSLGNLTEVDTDESYVGPDYDQVRVEFTAQEGVPYWFQVGGYYGDWGDLTFMVTAPGSISGTVVDAATDEPIASLVVRAVLGSTTKAQVTTDASGHYSLDGLTPGDYLVQFSGLNYLYLPEWWDDHEFSVDADLVTVTWGEDTTGIDARLTRNDDPAAGPYWELRDCDTNVLTSHFSSDTSCFSLWTDRYLFWPYLENPYAGMIVTAPGGGDASSPCPSTAPCTLSQAIYDSGTGLLSAYYWYWYISGENRAPGIYTLEMCGGGSPSLCNHTLMTTTFTIADTGAGSTGSVTRYAGSNRYGTAAAISNGDFPDPSSVSTVFVATGLNYPDALAGAAVAGKVGAPLLLVDTNSIPDPTATELARLSPDTIVILGGNSAVSPDVEIALGAYASTVTRLAGANRYATAVEISQYGYAGTADTVIVATGGGFADALAGGPAAVAFGGPVLLTDPNTLPGIVAAEIARLSPSRIVVVGGTAAVSASVFDALKAIQANTVRLSGSNRYGTAVEISQDAFAGGSTRVYVATGLNFPDALAGAAAAGWYGAPVLLVPGTSVPASVSAEITRLGASEIIVLGGTGVVSLQVEGSLLDLI